ncbi:MAG: hypothetical protein HKP10_02445 [Kiritimatiellales bacterium]|nr:hypothetical protein [Kiritimatiellales bacterium]
MSGPRVNFLKKSEQRYQGAVSRRFMLVGVVVTPIVVIALLSSIKLVQYTSVKSDLKTSREIWADLEPRLELFKNENRGLVTNHKVMELLDGWQNSQASLVGLLTDIQDAVPANIQFTRLSIRSAMKSSTYDSPEDMQLAYDLIVEGISQGDEAETEVLRLPRELLAAEEVSTTFDSLKLASMRKRSGGGASNQREFRLVSEILD